MKDFVEHGIADRLRSAMLDQGQCEPFPEHRQMSGAKQPQRHVRHGFHVASNENRVVIGAGAVGPGDENHQGLGCTQESPPQMIRSMPRYSTRSTAESKRGNTETAGKTR